MTGGLGAGGDREILLRMARPVHRETGQKKPCLAGGVALTASGTGGRAGGPFAQLWIQPAAGDAGGAIGVALTIHHKVLGHPRIVAAAGDGMRGSYLGPAYTDAEIEAYLHRVGAVYEKLGAEALIERTARLLAEEKVIGWLQGRRSSPRSLGNRRGSGIRVGEVQGVNRRSSTGELAVCAECPGACGGVFGSRWNRRHVAVAPVPRSGGRR